MDVPEVVTLDMPREGKIGHKRYRWPDKTYGDIVPGSPKATEPIYALSYATIKGAGAGEKFEHLTPPKDCRSGNFVYFRMLLPESDAKALFSQMQEDPSLARSLMAETLHSQGLSDESISDWNVLPPYEKWRSDCGGLSRMAFRSAFDELPADSKIVEF